MGPRLPIDERLDALNMVAWTSSLLGDLPQVIEASQTAMSAVQPGQNPGFALGCASWNAYAQSLIGDWDALLRSVEFLRSRWLEAERLAASHALQGLLSGIDWARNRSEDELVRRWRDVADEIISRLSGGLSESISRSSR